MQEREEEEWMGKKQRGKKTEKIRGKCIRNVNVDAATCLRVTYI